MFAKIYDFSGNHKKSVQYTIEHLKDDASSAKKPSVAHLIFVLDRSGSMWGSIDDLKNILLKYLAVLEFSAPSTLVSTLSYSSTGDVTTHCSRLAVSELMKTDSKQLASIKKIRATCLTGMSQGLALANELVHDDEITGIILHSDGYANDPSPNSEYKSMDAICAKLATKNVFVNTVAHSRYSDFQFLSRIASSVSGTCIQAMNTKDVYDAIENSCNILVSGVGTPIELKADGYDHVIFVNKEKKKVVGADGDLVVKGAGSGPSIAIRVEYVDSIPAGYEHDSATDTFVMAVLTKYLASKGRLNEAKFAMLSTCLPDIYEKHYKALSSSQVAALCTDIDDFLFTNKACRHTASPKIGGGISVLEAVKVITENREHISLNMPTFVKGYSRKGLKKLAGKRLDDGSIEEPVVDAEYVSDSPYVAIGSFDINRSDATINMLVPQKIKLVDRKSRKEIPTIAGIRLDLTDYKKYTIVSNGEVNVDKLTVRIASKKAFENMKTAGLFAADRTFDSETDYDIVLSDMPVCDFGKSVAALPDFQDLANLSMLSKFLKYVAEGKSADYDETQIAKLKEHCISANLYVNMPTTVPYVDLQTAISNGEVDSRTVFSVEIGSTEILHTGKFKSTKECLEKRYAATVQPEEGKPAPETATQIWLSGATYAKKVLSARSKTTKADVMQEALYDELTGISGAMPIISGMEGKYGISGIVDAMKTRDSDKLAKAAAAVSKAEAAVWRDSVSPFVFYVGSTGLMPDGVDIEMLTSSDELMQRYPELSLTKSEKEDGTFFVMDKKYVISMYRESAYFSTEKGVAAIKLMKTASVEAD